MTAAQRKKQERRRDKDAGLKTWKVNIDNATRESLKRLTTAYGTGSQEKTFIKLISDALDRLSLSQSVAAFRPGAGEERPDPACATQPIDRVGDDAGVVNLYVRIPMKSANDSDSSRQGIPIIL